MGRILCAVTILAVVAMANCEDETRDAALLSSGNDKFTAKMFSEIALKNPSKSFVLSAFSVLTPLAQLSLASDGNTHDELLRAIGSPDDQTTKSIFQYMNSKLRSVKGIDLKMASKIYIADGYALNDEYAAVSRGTFQSDVKNVDFIDNKQTAAEINAWVEDQTNHRIKNLVDPNTLTVDTRAVLVNAIYFKGTWKYPFQKVLTRDSDFHVTRGRTIQVPTMYRRGDYLYSSSESLDAQLLEIPYEGDESAFYIILPNEIEGITELVNKLKDPSVLENAIQNMYQHEVEAYIPKFKIETKTDLKEVLSKVGVNEIFEPSKANLTKLIKDEKDLYISDAIQKAFIEINEEGAEAAAANSFGVISAVAYISRSIVFTADHPFVFLLRTGKIVLFNGVFYP
ncbi:antichymotrypsin-2-like [Battus philenor]|uniref:antichymotrypsin-2-like n=1 Tax=Battus philenor TaxID=42288 RepID=UPI0035CECA28